MIHLRPPHLSDVGYRRKFSDTRNAQICDFLEEIGKVSHDLFLKIPCQLPDFRNIFMPATITQMPKNIFRLVLLPITGLFHLLMNTIDFFMEAIQKRVGIRGMAYIFVLPNMVFFAMFSLVPLLINFYYAFTGGVKPLPKDRFPVGTGNFDILLECGNYLDSNSCRADLFWRGLQNTVWYVIFEVGAILIFSVLTAIILNQNIKGRGFFRSVFFYPTLLSSVVVALLWKWILQREGILNASLISVGFEPINFLLDANWSRFWVIFIGVWAKVGFYTLIILAGLQSIPSTLYEAANIDGAGRGASFRHITLPLLKPSLIVVLVLSFIRAVQVFDHVFVMTGGGPGTATQYIVQYIYSTGFATSLQNFGLAAAASIILGIILLILTLIQMRVTGSGEEEY